MARGLIAFALRFRTGAEDLLKLKKFFVHTRKKDLTLVAFALKMAQATPSLSYIGFALARWRRSGVVKCRRAGWGWWLFHVEHHSSRSHSRVISASMPARLSL